MDTWIVQMCRRSCLRQLTAWAVAGTLALTVTLLNVRYFQNFFEGPFKTSREDLDRISAPADVMHYFVQVKGDRAIDTGIQEVTRTMRNGRDVGSSISATFYALDVGGRLLIVKGGATEPLLAEGEIVPLPEEFERRFFNSPEMRTTKENFYPFMIDAYPFRYMGYFAAAFWCVYICGFIWRGYPAWRRLNNLALHPVAQRLGVANLSRELESIERELAHDVVLQKRIWTITKNYLVKRSYFSFDIFRFADVIWAYKRVVGTDLYAVLIFASGTAMIKASEREASQILIQSACCAPWALFGFSKEIHAVFRKNPGAVSAMVAERKRQWQLSGLNV